MTRYTYFLIAAITLALTAATWTTSPVELTITKNSRMWVDGTSTIHDWTCDVGRVEGTVEIDPAAGLVPRAALSVPAASIECNNGAMNRKVADALRVDEHPSITFTLSKAAVRADGDQLAIDATGLLELAGVARSVSASVVGKRLSDGSYTFTGTMPVTMSNHNVKPPTAMLGTLKTGDNVTVRFELTAAPARSVVGTK